MHAGIDRLVNEAAEQAKTPMDEAARRIRSKALIYGLVEVGICGEADVIEWPVHMGLCLGVDARSTEDDDREFHFNSNDMVKYHTASGAELRGVAAQLRAMLQGYNVKPHLAVVSVCRSIRDGYLPRRFVQAVETAVMHIISLLVDSPNVIVDARPTW